MRIEDLKPDQFQKYFESRLQGHKFQKSTGGVLTMCPFHEDRTPSLSINFEKGVWKCHAGSCGLYGGVIEFEKHFSQCDAQQALANIGEAIGISQMLMGGTGGLGKPEMTHDYYDEMGRLEFQVLRYPKNEMGKKRIIQRRPCHDCRNGKDSNCHNPNCRHGWVYKKDGTRKLLYRLPQVIQASDVYIFEGEKKADIFMSHLSELTIPKDLRVEATCSPEGAGKWRDEYSPYLTGKRVTVFCDNDEAGRKHGEQVAMSVSRSAAKVKVIPTLPGLEEKEDIWDFIVKHKRPLKEAMDVARQTKPWTRPDSGGTGMFISVSDFVKQAPAQKDWVIPGLIEYGSNGFFIAKPKGGKSFATIDLAIAIASGQQWLGFEVERKMNVAHFSREDNPDTTSWRYKHLLARRALHEDDLRNYIYLNTRRQTPRFMIDEEEWVLQAIRDMKALGTEFFILDVLNKMHGADENDNTEMREVMDRVDYMATETKAQWCIVHHYNKARGADEDAGLTEMMRGASAIAGAAEWLVGFFLVDEELGIRRAKFDTKADRNPKPFYWKIDSDRAAVEGISLTRVEYDPPKRGRRQGSNSAEDDEV